MSNLRRLWDLLKFQPDVITFWLVASTSAPWDMAHSTAEAWVYYRARLDELKAEAKRLDFRSVVSHVDTIYVQIGRTGIPTSSMIGWLFGELGKRLREEMEHPTVLVIPVSDRSYYETPLEGWDFVIDRYQSDQLTEDISEAGKCFATDRLTGCVFHLMRIVEFAVVDMYWMTGLPSDEKAHFGSVVEKLERFTQKTKHEDWPQIAKPHRAFLNAVLPHLHSVKNSWRNRVSHVGGRILPTDGYNRPDVTEMYMATRGLMKTMAESAPVRPDIALS